MFILIVPVVFILLFIIIEPFASMSVYGKPIKNEDLSTFLDKHLKEYDINEYAIPKKMLNKTGMPYIAQTPPISILFSWHIEDYGVVWGFSKNSKRLDECWNKKFKDYIVVKQPNLKDL
jgi:hypothetical protein